MTQQTVYIILGIFFATVGLTNFFLGIREPGKTILRLKLLGMNSALARSRATRIKTLQILNSIILISCCVACFYQAITHEEREERRRIEKERIWRNIRETSLINNPEWQAQKDRELIPDWMNKLNEIIDTNNAPAHASHATR